MDHIHHSHRHFHSRRAAPRVTLPEMPSPTALAQRALAHLVARKSADVCDTDEDLAQCRKYTQIPKLPIILGVV